MKIVTIPQKQSGTLNIHSLASEHYDRDIKFRKGTKFAVVLAAYYGDHYTTHKTADAAIARYDETKQSCRIVGIDGSLYGVDFGSQRLVHFGGNVNEG